MRIVVVDDHYPEGGMGEAVSNAIAGQGMTHLAVSEVPSAELIDNAVNKLINN